MPTSTIRKTRYQTRRRIRWRVRWRRCVVGPSRNARMRVTMRVLRTSTRLRLMIAVAIVIECSLVNSGSSCPSAQIQEVYSTSESTNPDWAAFVFTLRQTHGRFRASHPHPLLQRQKNRLQCSRRRRWPHPEPRPGCHWATVVFLCR
jgi:hypothetical protein